MWLGENCLALIYLRLLKALFNANMYYYKNKNRIKKHNKMKKITFKYLIWVLALLCCQPGWSSVPVYFAGLSYIGDAADMNAAAPFASSIINDSDKLAEYNKLLMSSVNKVPLDDISIVPGLGNTQSGNALTIALAIVEEQFQAEDTGDGYYAVKATTFGQIVLFDFIDKKVVSTIPFITSYTDSPKKISADYRRQIYKTVYFDQSKKINLINEFVAKLADVNFQKPFDSWNIKVRNVLFTPFAEKKISQYGANPKTLDTRIANQFSAAMSKQLGIPVLTYSKGQAIGGAMAMRFENVEALQLELPPANYYVDLTLLGFSKKIMKETANIIIPSFIAGMRVSIGDVDFDELVFSEKAQSGRVLKLSKKLKVNEWNEFKNSLTVLSDEFCMQLTKPDKKWFKEKMFSKKSFKKFKKSTRELEKDIFDKLR